MGSHMFKKTTIIVCAAVLTLLSAAWAAPASELGYKACLALHIAQRKAFTLTHPLPPSGFAGNSTAPPVEAGFSAPSVPVLMYHYIVPSRYNKEPRNRSIVNAETFEAGMKYLHDNGYYTASLQELEDYIHGFASLPPKTVVLTFDDGYENNVAYAYPVMKKYGFKASLFVVGANIPETNGPFNPLGRSYVSREQMESTADVFEFHSHTYDLHYKTEQHCGLDISAAADADRLAPDIRRMKAAGIDTPYFAYPFGETNYRAVYRLAEAGYRMAFTVKDGYVRPGDHPMYLRRIAVTNETDLAAVLEGAIEPER